MKPAAPPDDATALIDARIAGLADWRGATLAAVRAVIRAADPAIVEEWKWGTPVWSCGGIVCTGESYQRVVKLTFAKGAALPDPARLFNSSLDGNVRRAIDLREGEALDARALTALVRAAVARNRAGASDKAAARPARARAVAAEKAKAKARPTVKAKATATARPTAKAATKPRTTAR